MTTTTLRPNGTVTGFSGGLTGGATAHAVTSDDSDGSYGLLDDPVSGIAVLDVGTVSLPAGAVTKTVTLRARGRAVTGTAGLNCSLSYSDPGSSDITGAAFTHVFGTTIATVAGSATPVTVSQTAVDSLRVKVAMTSAADVRVVELYVDLVHATAPVAAITFPTGSPTITTTNRPTYTWTHTPGDDGGAQTHFEVKVFTDAQIAAGGFSAATSTPYWESGVVVGSGTSQLSGPLATGDSYGVYVRTAQTINGAAHWSVFDSETFTVTVDTADIEDLTTTADNARILVAVDRVVASEAWNFIEVQRSTDTGVTWSYVRGGEYVVPSVTTAFSTGDASNFDIYDYETGNGETAIYRARATRILSDLPIAGEWVESTPAIAWTSTSDVWLKAPNDPTLNRVVRLLNNPEPVFERQQGVFAVLGATRPVVISDVLQAAAGQLVFQTATPQAATDLCALLAEPVLLLQLPTAYGWGSRFIAPGVVVESPVFAQKIDPYRRYQVGFTEVDPPADPLAGSP